MLNDPFAILVVSATVMGNASKVFEAMGPGRWMPCRPQLDSTEALRAAKTAGKIRGFTG